MTFCTCTQGKCCNHCWREAARAEPCTREPQCKNPLGHKGSCGPFANTGVIVISEAELMRALFGAALLLVLAACGRVATVPDDDAGDPIAHDAAGPVVVHDAGNPSDAGFQDAASDRESPGADAGNVADAGACALDECDCPWLAKNCSFYAPVRACGVSAACAQTFDVDLTTCTRTVHTTSTDGGTCELHDDGVTWCCP
jgi:hypothetical protein